MLEIERKEMRCTMLLPPGLIRDEDINDDGDDEVDNIDNDEDLSL